MQTSSLPCPVEFGTRSMPSPEQASAGAGLCGNFEMSSADLCGSIIEQALQVDLWNESFLAEQWMFLMFGLLLSFRTCLFFPALKMLQKWLKPASVGPRCAQTSVEDTGMPSRGVFARWCGGSVFAAENLIESAYQPRR